MPGDILDLGWVYTNMQKGMFLFPAIWLKRQLEC